MVDRVSAIPDNERAQLFASPPVRPIGRGPHAHRQVQPDLISEAELSQPAANDGSDRLGNRPLRQRVNQPPRSAPLPRSAQLPPPPHPPPPPPPPSLPFVHVPPEPTPH